MYYIVEQQGHVRLGRSAGLAVVLQALPEMLSAVNNHEPHDEALEYPKHSTSVSAGAWYDSTAFRNTSLPEVRLGA
jgi:hypothetical protein